MLKLANGAGGWLLYPTGPAEFAGSGAGGGVMVGVTWWGGVSHDWDSVTVAMWYKLLCKGGAFSGGWSIWMINMCSVRNYNSVWNL